MQRRDVRSAPVLASRGADQGTAPAGERQGRLSDRGAKQVRAVRRRRVRWCADDLADDRSVTPT
jgi:hypothetical protein